jgi:hypothetical protein
MRCELADRHQPKLDTHSDSKSAVVAHVRYYVKRRSVHANLAASDVAPNISSSVLVGFPHDLRIYDHRPSEGDLLVT